VQVCGQDAPANEAAAEASRHVAAVVGSQPNDRAGSGVNVALHFQLETDKYLTENGAKLRPAQAPAVAGGLELSVRVESVAEVRLFANRVAIVALALTTVIGSFALLWLVIWETMR
jgi:hypothetical protein